MSLGNDIIDVGGTGGGETGGTGGGETGGTGGGETGGTGGDETGGTGGGETGNDEPIPTDPTVCNEHAVYSAEDKELTIPIIEIPVYSPIGGEIVGTETFSATFKYIGFDYLQLESIANLADGVDPNSDCRALYGYEGKGYVIPFVDIQTVVGDGSLPGPVMTFQVRMPWNELKNMHRVEKVIQLK